MSLSRNRVADVQLGSLFSPKSKAAEGRSTNSFDSFAPAGALQVQMLPCCSNGTDPPEPAPQGSDGRVLAAFTSDTGSPMMTHGMEFPPEEVMHPGEMILERML